MEVQCALAVERPSAGFLTGRRICVDDALQSLWCVLPLCVCVCAVYVLGTTRWWSISVFCVCVYACMYTACVCVYVCVWDLCHQSTVWFVDPRMLGAVTTGP